MSQNLSSGEQNLILLSSLIPSNEQFYIWAYSVERGIINTSCPAEERHTLDECLRLFGGMEKIWNHVKKMENTNPLIIGSAIGLQWAVILDSARAKDKAIVIGPVFYSSPVESQLRAALHPYIERAKSPSFSSELIRLSSKLPVMSYAIFSRYVILVHNTVNEQQLGMDSLNFGSSAGTQVHDSPAEKRDRGKVYLSERAMLQMVRNGDINYQGIFQNVMSGSPGVPVHGQDPLRQAKTSIIVFTSLVCRAAMEGGLSPEVAYSHGDSYIQSAEDCRDSGELSTLAHAMYHDFIYRVHHLHSNPNYSHAIQKCCDYIELSLDKRIRTADLAALVGYTEYYLTEKFKKETGQSVSSYIRFAKVERAKLLLETTDLTVRAIAESLSFNTANYFVQSFRETTGYTPMQYRAKFRQV